MAVRPSRPALQTQRRGRSMLALALAPAAVVLFLGFVVAGFPYQRLTPRLDSALETSTGAQVQIGSVGLGLGFAGPHLVARDVRFAWPDGTRLALSTVRLRPAWSLSWLHADPAIAFGLAGDIGTIDGTLRIGGGSGFDGRIRKLALDRLPLERFVPGLSASGHLNADVDLAMDGSLPAGSANFDARDGSIGLPGFPMEIPFQQLSGIVRLGGKVTAEIASFSLKGPLISFDLAGTIGRGPTPARAPLSLRGHIKVTDPTMRRLAAARGIPIGSDGSASFAVNGSFASPRIRGLRR